MFGDSFPAPAHELVIFIQGRLQLRALPLRGQEPLLHLHALPQSLSRCEKLLYHLKKGGQTAEQMLLN